MAIRVPLVAVDGLVRALPPGDSVTAPLESSTVTTNTTLNGETLVLVDASSGAVTITLPAAADFVGQLIHIKKTDATTLAVIIDGNASETIDGSLNQTITTQYVSVTLVSDGTEWYII